MTASGGGDNLTALSNNTSPASPNDVEVMNLYSLGVGFGQTTNTLFLLLYYPVSRSNFLTLIFGADYHQLIKYHKMISVMFFWLAWIHSGIFFVIGICQNDWVQAVFTFQRYDHSTVFGTLALTVLTVMYFASKPWVRQHYFRVSCKREKQLAHKPHLEPLLRLSNTSTSWAPSSCLALRSCT